MHIQETVLILDFGSQYTQLIARRIREHNVYCEIHPYNSIPSNIENLKGVVLSGSPFSVNDSDAPKPDLAGFRGNVPVLGVCYGAQLMASENGGEVAPSNTREYGRANLSFVAEDDLLFSEVNCGSQVWMSHGDTIQRLPDNSVNIASTEDVKNAWNTFKAAQ